MMKSNYAQTISQILHTRSGRNEYDISLLVLLLSCVRSDVGSKAGGDACFTGKPFVAHQLADILNRVALDPARDHHPWVQRVVDHYGLLPEPGNQREVDT